MADTLITTISIILIVLAIVGLVFLVILKKRQKNRIPDEILDIFNECERRYVKHGGSKNAREILLEIERERAPNPAISGFTTGDSRFAEQIESQRLHEQSGDGFQLPSLASAGTEEHQQQPGSVDGSVTQRNKRSRRKFNPI